MRTVVAHAEEVIWARVKGNSAFLHKTRQGGSKVQISFDPTDPYNLNTFKFSSLANAKSAGIASGADGAVVTKSPPSNSSKPSAGVTQYTTKKDARKAMASIEKQLDCRRTPDDGASPAAPDAAATDLGQPGNHVGAACCP